MRVCVVGTGYVGLISGVCLADKGHEVVCVDTNRDVVRKLNAAEPTIYEKDLPDLLKKVVKAGNFRATENLKSGILNSEVVIVAVGTPSKEGSIDLKYVKDACYEIGKCLASMERHVSIIIKSTVIPGTTDTIVREVLEVSSGKTLGEFGLGMNPEFLREGDAIEDFLHPDRIVFGYESQKTLDDLEKLYAPWEVDKLKVNSRTAELVKYANNAVLATLISTMNEIANFAATVGGIDVMNVVRGIHMDERWNPTISGARVNPKILDYLRPGCGFGGSCFPKDVEALRSQGENFGADMKLMNAVLAVNESQPAQVVKILKNHISDLRNRKILVLGLSFKPGTDDVRNSPATTIIKSLIKSSATIFAHDPVALDKFSQDFPLISEKIHLISDWESYIPLVDVIIIVTPWEEYFNLQKLDLTGKILFDSRQSFERETVNPDQYLSICITS